MTCSLDRPKATPTTVADRQHPGIDAGYRMPFDNRRICARMLLDEALVNLRLMPWFHPVFSVDEGRENPWVGGSTSEVEPPKGGVAG
jgi:hypothetical protein